MRHVDQKPEHYKGLGPGVFGRCPECLREARLRGPLPAPPDARTHICEACGWLVDPDGRANV